VPFGSRLKKGRVPVDPLANERGLTVDESGRLVPVPTGTEVGDLAAADGEHMEIAISS
jgi:hypothetical protein